MVRRLGDDRAEPDAREDEDVVGLADLVAHAVERRPRRTASPVATSARPSVQRRTSAGVASAADVGFDSGRTIGRSAGPTRSAIARMTASVNVPATPVVADEDRRPTVADRLEQAWAWPRPIRRRRTARLALRVVEVVAAGVDQPVRIDEGDRSATAAADSPASSIASRSRRAIPIPAAPAPASTTRASASDRPVARSPARTPATTTAAVPWMSSLKDGHAIAVAVEDAQRVGLLEVLELDDAARPDLLDAGDERLDERVVVGAAQARRPMAEVERVGQEGRVVGPDVERDRQGQRPDGSRRPPCTAASLPIGMAMPPAPWSPRPRIRSLSVTTMSRTSSNGPWRSSSGIRSRSAGVIHVPRVRRMMWLNSWQARPTVGV